MLSSILTMALSGKYDSGPFHRVVNSDSENKLIQPRSHSQKGQELILVGSDCNI